MSEQSQIIWTPLEISLRAFMGYPWVINHLFVIISYHVPCFILAFILKGKEHKNTNELCLIVFGKLHILMQTAWKSDTYF